MSTLPTIAFIGLGNMGGPMSAQLAQAGYTVRGFDVSKEAKQAAKHAGVRVFDTVAQASESAEIIMTMLPNGKLVENVLTEAFEAGAQPEMCIDSSTIAVSEARELAELVSSRGSAFIDAPVSGGVTGAEAGQLAFMVGGPEKDFQQAEPLFTVMGKTHTYCGPAGAGQAVKACNNMILAVQQTVLAEALVLGERLGLSHQAFYDVVSNATGNSWSLSVNCPVPEVVPNSPANRDFQPGFSSALMLKDLNLAMVSAQETGTETLLGSQVTELFADFVEEGNGSLDFSAIIKRVRDAKKS